MVSILAKVFVCTISVWSHHGINAEMGLFLDPDGMRNMPRIAAKTKPPAAKSGCSSHVREELRTLIRPRAIDLLHLQDLVCITKPSSSKCLARARSVIIGSSKLRTGRVKERVEIPHRLVRLVCQRVVLQLPQD